MNQNIRVVVTGLGAITPVGNDVQSFWEGICEGKSGVGKITLFDSTKFDCHIAAEVKGFNPENFMEKKEARRFDRFIQFALAASQMAVDDAKLNMTQEDAHRVGVLLGSGIGGIKYFEDQCKVLFEKGPSRISPFLIPMLIVNMASGLVSIRVGAKGANLAVATACASASHAIGVSYDILKKGDVQVMITGGSEAAICQVGIGGFCAMGALSLRNDAPEKASRPFEKNRDGFVMGEGAGIVVLETLDHAVKRGAKIYAEVVGFGMSGDAYHMTAPSEDGEGAIHCMQMAMKEARVSPAQVQYINAHGTSTLLNDKIETLAIKKIFAEQAGQVAVSSTKSTTGHLLGASGGVEFIASVLAITHGVLPPTVNYEEKDPDCDLDYVPNKARKKDVEMALSNSFGFGGHNVTLAVKKYRV